MPSRARVLLLAVLLAACRRGGTDAARAMDASAPGEAAAPLPPAPEALVLLGDDAPRAAVFAGRSRVVVGLGDELLRADVTGGEEQRITLPEEVVVAGARSADVVVGLGARALHVVRDGALARSIELHGLGAKREGAVPVQVSDDGLVALVRTSDGAHTFATDSGAPLASGLGEDAVLDPSGAFVASRNKVASARDGSEIASARATSIPSWVSGLAVLVEANAVAIVDPKAKATARVTLPCRTDDVVANGAVDVEGRRVVVDCRDRIVVVDVAGAKATEIPLAPAQRFVRGPGEEAAYGPTAPAVGEDGRLYVDRRWSPKAPLLRVDVAARTVRAEARPGPVRIGPSTRRGPCRLPPSPGTVARDLECDEVTSPDGRHVLALAPPSVGLFEAASGKLVARWGPRLTARAHACAAEVRASGLDVFTCLAAGGTSPPRLVRIGPDAGGAPSMVPRPECKMPAPIAANVRRLSGRDVYLEGPRACLCGGAGCKVVTSTSSSLEDASEHGLLALDVRTAHVELLDLEDGKLLRSAPLGMPCLRARVDPSGDAAVLFCTPPADGGGAGGEAGAVLLEIGLPGLEERRTVVAAEPSASRALVGVSGTRVVLWDKAAPTPTFRVLDRATGSFVARAHVWGGSTAVVHASGDVTFDPEAVASRCLVGDRALPFAPRCLARREGAPRFSLE